MKHFKEIYSTNNQRSDVIEEKSNNLSDACWKGYKAIGMKKKGGRMVPNCVPEEVELQEGRMAELHANLSAHLDKHIKNYNAGKLGHDSFGEKVVAAHQKISKLHGIKPEHAKEFVNDYVNQRIKEEVELDEMDKSQTPPGRGSENEYNPSGKTHYGKPVTTKKMGRDALNVLKKVKKEEVEHTEPKTKKEKDLAALAHPKDKITHKDVLVGRGVIKKEETELEEGDVIHFPGKMKAEKEKPDTAPGWMLRKNPELAQKIKDAQDRVKKRKDVLVGRGVIKKEEWDSEEHAVSEADQINELSTKTLFNYAMKAPKTIKKGEVYPKREAGIETAMKKIAARATSEEIDSRTPTIDEAENKDKDIPFEGPYTKVKMTKQPGQKTPPEYSHVRAAAREAMKKMIQQNRMKKEGLELENEVEELDEKAVSQAQQKFMGMVHSYKQGEMKDASPSIVKAAASMTDKEAKKFASTKHKGLPEKVKEEVESLDEGNKENKAKKTEETQPINELSSKLLGKAAEVAKNKSRDLYKQGHEISGGEYINQASRLKQAANKAEKKEREAADIAAMSKAKARKLNREEVEIEVDDSMEQYLSAIKNNKNFRNTN